MTGNQEILQYEIILSTYTCSNLVRYVFALLTWLISMNRENVIAPSLLKKEYRNSINNSYRQ